MMRRGFGVVLGLLAVSLTAMTAWPDAAEADAKPAAAIEGEAAHAARVAAFAAYLEQRRAEREAAPLPDPFAQLTQIGIDGEGLREAVIEAAIDLGELAAFDLTLIDLPGIATEERDCLAQAIYYEARNQSVAGKAAVADVVLNRVESKRWPASVCRVVYQGAQRDTGCQFSFTCDGSMTLPIERRAMAEAEALATAILGGFRLSLSHGATNYHAHYVDPYWAPALERTAVVGDHVFYRRSGKPIRLAALD